MGHDQTWELGAFGRSGLGLKEPAAQDDLVAGLELDIFFPHGSDVFDSVMCLYCSVASERSNGTTFSDRCRTMDAV